MLVGYTNADDIVEFTIKWARMLGMPAALLLVSADGNVTLGWLHCELVYVERYCTGAGFFFLARCVADALHYWRTMHMPQGCALCDPRVVLMWSSNGQTDPDTPQ